MMMSMSEDPETSLCCRRKGNDVSAKRIQLIAAIGASIF
jgi:hypothetical protein